MPNEPKHLLPSPLQLVHKIALKKTPNIDRYLHFRTSKKCQNTIHICILLKTKIHLSRCSYHSKKTHKSDHLTPIPLFIPLWDTQKIPDPLIHTHQNHPQKRSRHDDTGTGPQTLNPNPSTQAVPDRISIDTHTQIRPDLNPKKNPTRLSLSWDTCDRISIPKKIRPEILWDRQSPENIQTDSDQKKNRPKKYNSPNPKPFEFKSQDKLWPEKFLIEEISRKKIQNSTKSRTISTTLTSKKCKKKKICESSPP